MGLDHKRNPGGGIYGEKGRPTLVFDFGYVIGPEVRFFQAVPLLTKSNQSIAVNIAYHFPEVADCIHAENGSRALLTAIVSDDLKNPLEIPASSLRSMPSNSFMCMWPRVAEMPSIADRARQELRRAATIESADTRISL